MRAAAWLLLAFSTQAAEMTGYVSDAACGWNNARPGKEARECALKCVKAGWDPVFVKDGDMNVYKFADKSAVMPFVGDRVAVEGDIKAGVVTVRKIRRYGGPSPTASQSARSASGSPASTRSRETSRGRVASDASRP